MDKIIRHFTGLPADLIQQHEDGKVVFFCGAGISYNAGLPGFGGLVDRLYEGLGVNKELSGFGKESIKKEQYDTALNTLERTYSGGRDDVRKKLVEVLAPDLELPGAKDTHKALLHLAKNRDNKLRLITTNFDRIFESILSDKEENIDKHIAPYLPIPKSSKWDGLVYIHGLLPEEYNKEMLDRIVMTSGDFGVAYLTERWASRFITELFQNYTVCFVGYSLNDPVLRYMTDALAAEAKFRDDTISAYAFVGVRDGSDAIVQGIYNWEKSRGIEPLFYEVVDGNHQQLHALIQDWANVYSDGLEGRRALISQYAQHEPTEEILLKMQWALQDELAVKFFAEMEPAPNIEWLEVFSESVFKECSTQLTIDAKIINHPFLDSKMRHFARWLVRYLNDPRLIIWFARQNRLLHNDFIQLLQGKLQYLKSRNESELDEIIKKTPEAVPAPVMKNLWSLLISGKCQYSSNQSAAIYWLEMVKNIGLTEAMKIRLKDILSPKIMLRSPINFKEQHGYPTQETSVNDIVHADLILTGEYYNPVYFNDKEQEIWEELLPQMVDDFTQLLHDAMQLLQQVQQANSEYDLSYLTLPSIQDHYQNRMARDWAILITLARDSWVVVSEFNREKARHVAKFWLHKDFPVFKRLAFFAATHSSIIDIQEALDWLLCDKGKWLWTTIVQREVIRLMVYIYSEGTQSQQQQLLETILCGPDSSLFNNLPEEKRTEFIDHSVWLRLSKLNALDNTELSIDAKKKLQALSAKTSWKLADDDRDEFLFWMSNGRDMVEVIPMPEKMEDLALWLKNNSNRDPWTEDSWRSRCREDFEITSNSLILLTQNGDWPSVRWKEAFSAWRDEEIIEVIWYKIAPVLLKGEESFIESISLELARWLNAAVTVVATDEQFLNLCIRVLRITKPHSGFPQHDDIVLYAINHSIGEITDTLLKLLDFKLKNSDLSYKETIFPIFSEICNPEIEKYYSGRIILAQHAVYLFQIDPEWTIKNLLSLFDWKNSETEAAAVWQGFLTKPYLNHEYLSKLKPYFVDAGNHYHLLTKQGDQFSSFLTAMAIHKIDTLSDTEYAMIFDKMPSEALSNVVGTLIQYVDGIEDKNERYWENRILPFFHKFYPKNEDKRTSLISMQLSRLCIKAGNLFPPAFKEIGPLIYRFKDVHRVIHDLYKSSLCVSFPEIALGFLDKTVDDEPPLYSTGLKDCLEIIKQAKPELEDDMRFQRLIDIVHRYGS